MGYLDNTSITVDAILTKKGRELLAKNDGSFNITQFALGDSEIDYTLFNETHPNGTQYSAEAIENMPLIEAIPDGSNMMKSQLITLSRGKSLLPFISVPGYNNNAIQLTKGQSGLTISPETHNMDQSSTTAGIESGGYKFTVVNFNYLSEMTSDNPSTMSPNELESYGGTAEIAESVGGNSVILSPTNQDALFPSVNMSLTTTLIIEGMTTGARKTLQIVISN